MTKRNRFATGFAVALLMLILVGCDDFPNDIAGTMKGVTEKGVLHAGMIADGPAEANERSLVQQVAQAVGVKAELDAGSAETLLRRLEEGKLDLVVGEFAKATPWGARVAFTPSPRAKSPPSHEPVLRAAVRLGENRWLMFVSKTLMENPDAAGA